MTPSELKKAVLSRRRTIGPHAHGGRGAHGHLREADPGAKSTVNGVAPAQPPLVRGATPRPEQRFAVGRLLLDTSALVVANLVVLTAGESGPSTLYLLLFDAVALGLMLAWRTYAPRLKLDFFDDVRSAVASTAVAAWTVVAVEALVSPSESGAADALRLWLVSSALLAVVRIGSTYSLLRARRRGQLGSPTLIIGAGLVGQLAAKRLLEHHEFGLRPIGFLDKNPLDMHGRPLPLPVLGSSWSLEETVSTHGVTDIVIAFSNAPHDVLLGLIDECERLGVRPLIVPRLFERVPSRLRVTHVGGLPLLELLPTNPRSFQYAIKYVLDRVAALALLVLLAPLLAAIALAVWLSLGRPILYGQRRVGMDGREFRMLKFRTMRPPAADEGVAGHVMPFLEEETAPGGVEGADRRTRLGAFLRRSSLDELAQLFNVLHGEMSLVGPRPERPEFVEYFGERVRRYEARHRVKSGITGWAQIHRLRGQTSITDRVEWDNYYIENFSLWLDVKILLRTVPEVLRGGAE
jgi:exopolysaccharide biosynthesis polyprenyl glycosylphosphotransferase